MKKGMTAVLIILALIIPIAVVNASQVKTTQVSAGSSNMLTFNLDKDDKFEGSLSISGGSGNDIDFSVTDPQGSTILGFGRVSQGRSFEFTAQKSGAYTLHLGNTFSVFSSKTVTITYDITPSMLNTEIGNGAFLVILGAAIIVIVVVVVILGIVLSKRKTTPQGF